MIDVEAVDEHACVGRRSVIPFGCADSTAFDP
jgi:hypothetical protein